MIVRGADTETVALDDGTCQPLVVLSVDGVLTHRRDVSPNVIDELFDGPTAWAHAPTDLAVLSRHRGSVVPAFRALARGLVYDVLTRQKLLDTAVGRKRAKHSLETVAAIYGHTKHADDPWRKRYGELFDTPLIYWPADAKAYAEGDSVVARAIFEEQEKHAAKLPGVFDTQAMQARAHWALHLSSLFGMAVDREAVELFAANLEVLWRRRFEQLAAVGLVRAKDGSKDTKAAGAHARNPKALWAEHRERLRELGLEENPDAEPITAKTSSGKETSLTKETCDDSGDPLLIAYADFEHLGKLKGTFVKMLRSAKRLRPHYNECLETNRTSASKPNIQQLPRAPGIRECCVPDPGCCLVSVDVDKAELCALADLELEILGESKLADAIAKKLDPHCMIGAELLGISFDDFMTRYRAGDAECDDARQDGKPGNFGFPVDMGPATYVKYARGQGRELSLERATQVKRAWKRLWSTTVKYQHAVKRLLDRCKGNVRHPMSGFLRGRLRFTQAANGFFQERVAIAMKEVLWVVACLQWGFPVEGFDAERYAPLVGTRTVAFIHDELIVQCPIDTASQVATLVREVVERVVQKWIPRVPITAGAVAMMRWSKKAKPVHDEEGRLIPWVPKAA